VVQLGHCELVCGAIQDAADLEGAIRDSSFDPLGRTATEPSGNRSRPRSHRHGTRHLLGQSRVTVVFKSHASASKYLAVRCCRPIKLDRDISRRTQTIHAIPLPALFESAAEADGSFVIGGPQAALRITLDGRLLPAVAYGDALRFAPHGCRRLVPEQPLPPMQTTS
jgi:hypothetical protein